MTREHDIGNDAGGIKGGLQRFDDTLAAGVAAVAIRRMMETKNKSAASTGGAAGLGNCCQALAEPMHLLLAARGFEQVAWAIRHIGVKADQVNKRAIQMPVHARLRHHLTINGSAAPMHGRLRRTKVVLKGD